MQMSLNFELSEQQQMVEGAVRRAMQPWVEKRSEIRAMARDGKFPDAIWSDFAEVGLLGALIPEEYGGNDMGLVALSLGFETITAMGLSPGLLLVASMDAACIAQCGSDELKREYLPRIADGSIKMCFAITEADSGTNAMSMKTTAQRTDEGYRINGNKLYITGSDVADYMLLVARTMPRGEAIEKGLGSHHGISLFVVDMKSPGISMQEIPVGFSEGVRQFAIFFDDVLVPEDQVIGQPDQGAMAMFTSLNPERILAAAMGSGMSRYCIDRAVQQAKDRKVFKGKPIGSYQAISHPLAECHVQHAAARLLMLQAAWAHDSGQPTQRVGSLANMSKMINADVAIRASDVCIEVFGGNGFTEEYGFLDQYNGARLLKTAPVSREMILNFVSEWDLGLPKSY